MRKPSVRSSCGSGGCVECPFSCNEQAEIVYNYACLPTPYDIVSMKEKSGHNWACHEDETILCGGFVRHLKDCRPDLSAKVGNLLSYDAWYQEGEKSACLQADHQESYIRTLLFLQQISKELVLVANEEGFQVKWLRPSKVNTLAKFVHYLTVTFPYGEVDYEPYRLAILQEMHAVQETLLTSSIPSKAI